MDLSGSHIYIHVIYIIRVLAGYKIADLSMAAGIIFFIFALHIRSKPPYIPQGVGNILDET